MLPLVTVDVIQLKGNKALRRTGRVKTHEQLQQTAAVVLKATLRTTDKGKRVIWGRALWQTVIEQATM